MINIVVLIIQIIILLLQLVITYKHNRSVALLDRGIFLLDHKGAGIRHNNYRMNYYDFDRDIYRFVVFHITNANTILLNTKIEINGLIRYQLSVDNNSIFSVDDQNNGVRVVLPLSDKDLADHRFDCRIRFKLQNLSNLEYIETVDLSFAKEDENSTYWHLEKYYPHFE